VNGRVACGFEGVADAFARNLAERDELGGAFGTDARAGALLQALHDAVGGELVDRLTSSESGAMLGEQAEGASDSAQVAADRSGGEVDACRT
jgi:hypothetical protein